MQKNKILRLKQLRTERGLKIQDMAELLGVSQGSYNYYELGNTEPSIEKLTKLADFFCVSIDYLVGATSHRDFETSASSITDDEAQLLKYYRGMNDSGRDSIMTTARNFYNLVISKTERAN